MSEPLTVITEEILPKGFHRQIPLLSEIRKIQSECQHTLFPTEKNTIICTECNAVWIR